MTTWIIEPRDPLIVRDGRPFGPDPGVRAASLAFPFPSTTTGGARNRFGLDADGLFMQDRIEEVKGLAVRGPLLVEIDDAEQIAWHAPAPADALILPAHQGHLKAVPLRPLELAQGAATSLPGGLRPVGLAERTKGKPPEGVPQFWRWDRFERWLASPGAQICAPNELGLGGLPRDVRVHVSIADETLSAADGALFQTIGLAFTSGERRRLGLAIVAEQPFPHFPGGLAPLAGERRIVAWRSQSAGLPACPPEVRAEIVRTGSCRAVLLTPAYFAEGSYPGRLLAPSHGVTPRLEGAAVGRPQIVSGWDMALGRPKPTRRLVPAGSVYFLSLEGDPAARGAWVDAHWMACVCDDTAEFSAARDGFGLLALGAWDGELTTIGASDARS